MNTVQVTLIAGALSMGQAWAANDVDLPVLPMQLHNQNELLTILETMNTGKIASWELAMQRGNHADIKALGNVLINVHTRANERIDELKRGHFEPQPTDLSEQIEMRASQRLESFSNLEASKFDCAFLSEQADQYQLAFQLVNRQMESPDAMLEPVHSFLDRTLGELQASRRSLQALLTQSSC